VTSVSAEAPGGARLCDTDAPRVEKPVDQPVDPGPPDPTGGTPGGRYPMRGRPGMGSMGPDSMRTMYRIRWVLIGLSFLLALALLLSGAIVIGALLMLLAVTRTVMFLKWQERRRSIQARWSGERPVE
jgi:hypothetical protein